MPMTVLGAGLLWFGWFGFNAGSAVAADGLAASAFMVTNIAAAAATITWVLASYLRIAQGQRRRRRLRRGRGPRRDHPGLGLRDRRRRARSSASSPAACASAPRSCASALKVDDALDVFAVHGVGGMFGAIATGIFASSRDPDRLHRPARGQPAAARQPAHRGRRDRRLRGRRHLRHRQGRRPHPRHPGQARKPRRWASTCPSTARSPIRCDAEAPPARRRAPPNRPPSTPRSTAAGPSPPGAASEQVDRATVPAAPPPRCTTRATSTTRAASGSSRTPAGARAIGSCRWPSPGWPRSAIAGRSGRTASRATAPASRCRSIGRCSSCSPGEPRRRTRPGIVSLFLPRARGARAARPGARRGDVRGGRPAGRRLAAGAVRRRGARRVRRRVAAGVRAGDRRASVARRRRPAAGHRRCLRAPARRRPAAARDRRPRGRRRAGRARRCPSASARTIVYKGLVIGGRLADLYPDLRAPLSVGYAVFHQRYATNTHPVWRLAQPFRSIAHNGEINTVRGNREQVRGRAADAATARRSRGSCSPPARCCPRTAPTRCRSTRRSSS